MEDERRDDPGVSAASHLAFGARSRDALDGEGDRTVTDHDSVAVVNIRQEGLVVDTDQ